MRCRAASHPYSYQGRLSVSSDWLGLLISHIYVFAIIFAGEGLRKWRGCSADLTRKVIHVGVGVWVFATVALFER